MERRPSGALALLFYRYPRPFRNPRITGVGRVGGILIGVLVFEALKICLQFLGVDPAYTYMLPPMAYMYLPWRVLL